MSELKINYHYLKGITYPTTKKDLILLAKKNEAPIDFINFLKDLPDKEFMNVFEIWSNYDVSEVIKAL